MKVLAAWVLLVACAVANVYQVNSQHKTLLEGQAISQVRP